MLRSVKYGLYGAVLAGLVGGTVAWTNVDKTVHLMVDGHERTVHTTAADVAQVLKNAGYHPDAHDLVAPNASAPVRDGSTIVLKRGRLLRLDVDGSDQLVWTTAPTVSLALTELGFGTTDFTSVSRARRLALGATDIAVRTPKYVTVVHDGQPTSVTTTDETVGQLLSDLSVAVGPQDHLSVPATSLVSAGATITVSRVVHKTLSKTSAVPFSTTSTPDKTLAKGSTRIVTPGRKGVMRTIWSAVYVDGTLVGQTEVSSSVVRKPVSKVVKVGTKKAQPAEGSSSSSSGSSSSSASSGSSGSDEPTGSPKTIAKALLKNYGWSQDQFSCLDSIWSRESGWRVNAANPSGAYGIPQAKPGSKMSSAGPDWQSNATTQIKWGLNYISARYNSPCQAWSTWQSQGWY